MINEKYFNGIVILGTLALLFIQVSSGSVSMNTLVGNLSGILFNVALFLGVAFGLQKFQGGFGVDVPKEIYEQNNIAAAIYQSGVFLAIALIISKGLF